MERSSRNFQLSSRSSNRKFQAIFASTMPLIWSLGILWSQQRSQNWVPEESGNQSAILLLHFHVEGSFPDYNNQKTRMVRPSKLLITFCLHQVIAFNFKLAVFYAKQTLTEKQSKRMTAHKRYKIQRKVSYVLYT